jgi:hypothetical protein
METLSTAASPDQLAPRTYSKAKLAECNATLMALQLLPWSPLRLHRAAFAASTRRSVPIVLPSMW